MLVLVPEWAHFYGEFWKAIRLRNLWFIRLRYLAVFSLIGFLLFGEFILNFDFTPTQIRAIISISVIILIYNIVIQITRKFAASEPNKFNGLHISLIQMICDLIALMILIYFTGGIDSPLYMFFIFHTIIGSMILPGTVVYLVAGIISVLFSTMVFLERFDILNRHIINGLFLGERNHTLSHDVLFIIIFTLMLFISVYIANKIAKQLYHREQQLRSSIEKLNESEIAKQKYTIGIVHEIKTPVNAVMSILELIHNKYVGPVSQEVDEKIMRAKIRTEETLQLINDVLRISRVKLLEIKSTDIVDIKRLICNIIDELKEVMEEKNVNFNLSDKQTGENEFKTDKVLIELAVSNIIANAVKYVGKDGKIEIVLDKKDNNLFLEVSDNGIGIPESEIHRIFDQFYRASNINKNVHEGTGTGLPLVKEIVEKLGGSIKVISPSKLAEKGRPGTTFEITIPYQFKSSEYDIFEVHDSEYLNNNSDKD